MKKIFSTTLNATDNSDVNVEYDGLRVHGMVTAQDNPCPWKFNPAKYGIVSEWTNRDRLPCERILHQVQAFTDSAAGRGKLLYHFLSSRLKFGSAAKMEDDFLRLQAWCRGEWYYVDVAVQVYTMDDGNRPKVLGAQRMGSMESDDIETINICLERCARDALDETYQRVWQSFVGDDEDVQAAR
jgi:hypothetical protein